MATKKSIHQQLERAFGSLSKSEWVVDATQREQELNWKKNAQKIAVKILRTLRHKGWTQIEFAQKLNVSPQQVNKWVKAKENLTLETISKLEVALDTVLIDCNIPTIQPKMIKSDVIMWTLHKRIESNVNVKVSFRETKNYPFRKVYKLHTYES